MRVTNRTKWSTLDIIRLVYRIAQDELNPGGLKNAHIAIRYRRGNGISGRCCYGTIQNPNVRMRLSLPRMQIDPVSLAMVIAHELAHARGLHHRDMNAKRYKWGEGWRELYAYAKDFPIGIKPDPPKPTLNDKRRAELTKAQGMVIKWTRRHRLASTTLKKWQRRVRTIERRLVVAVPAAPSA
jgi:hypothetical protein